MTTDNRCVLNCYVLMFMIGGDITIYKSVKPPTQSAIRFAILILPPGVYEKPLKDRFGLFFLDLHEEFSEDSFLQLWEQK